MTPGLRRVCWRPSWRLVASRFPPVGLFDRVTSDEDLETVLAIEGLTNERLRDEVGDIRLVSEADRIHGPGTTPIMAAFTHINPAGSRFSDGTYGVYYAAHTLETAVTETAFHRARFLAATHEPPIEIDMRSYAADIDAELHDITGRQGTLPELYDPDPARYGAAQRFARALRDAGSNGIAYSSVRDPGGECIAVFRPRILQPVKQGSHLCYVWDGARIGHIYKKSKFP